MPKEAKPVVFGEKTRPTVAELPLKEQQMRLEKSKYLSAPKPKKSPTSENNWKEIQLSEALLINALNYALSMNMTKVLKRDEVIERVLVGEPANGVYPLSVAIIKRKEV